MKGLSETGNAICLNCGKKVAGKYCSNCGQKYQPTKVPIRIFLEDAAESLFNIDNRVFKTVKELFLKPGFSTTEYLEGKRARYLPPFRIYLTASLIYFLVISLVDSKEVLLASVNQDEGKSFFSEFIQYSMIFLVPAFAGLLKLLYRKQKRFYVEFLIFSMHLHVPWFFFFGVNAICDYFLNTEMLQGWQATVINVIAVISNLMIFFYLVVYIKNVFKEGWIRTILKSFLVTLGYILILALIVLSYIYILNFL